MTTPTRRRRPARWVPNQHGAWAMLVVPFAVGTVARLESGEPSWFLVPLLLCWIAGYFAFFAASGWLKAPASRRGAWVRPFVIAAAITLLSGIATLVLAGPRLAWWIPGFVVLLTPALLLARLRRERDWTAGALTVAAASVMTLVARYPDPTQMLAAQDLTRMLVHTGATFAYFFGTVLYVKTNIRERGSRTFYAASVGWHVAATILAGALGAAGLAPWWWTVFFLAATARAVVVPRLVPALTPRTIGLVEGVFSAALVVGAAVA